MYRRGSRDPRRWNMAGDYVINDMLAAEKIGRMPEGGLMNSQLVVAGNGTTEGVYDLLPENAGGDGVGGDKQWDTCMDAGGSEADRSAGEAEMKVKVAQAAQAAKMCGNLSQRLEQFVGDVLKPKIDWRDVLRRFIDQRAKVEYTFARPKRRWVSEDLFLPSLGGSSLGEVLIAVDQSGSVGPDEVAEFKAEILAIHGDCRPSKLHVYYFDSKVAHKETYDPDDTPDIRRYTTGGTAFSPIFREADLDDLELSCCVVLTDLCCADFGPAPTYPVLWITTSATHAPWGQVVEMNQRRP
jgi:predicted metal-dependent peptidase